MKNLKVMHAQVCIDKIFNNAKLPDFPDTADAQQKVFFHSFNQPNKTLHDTPQSALCEKKSKDRGTLPRIPYTYTTLTDQLY